MEHKWLGGGGSAGCNPGFADDSLFVVAAFHEAQCFSWPTNINSKVLSLCAANYSSLLKIVSFNYKKYNQQSAAHACTSLLTGWLRA